MAWAPAIVYLLCLATSVVCAALLIRGYRQNRTSLLLYSALCFTLLAVNNLLLVIDVVVLPTQVDLIPLRHATALAGVSLLIFGFIWSND